MSPAQTELHRIEQTFRMIAPQPHPALELAIRWLHRNMPPPSEPTLVHGDYRMGNLIFHPTESRVIAVLDWELCTLGHPLSDLGYNCLLWHIPEPPHGVGPVDLAALGIPTLTTCVALSLGSGTSDCRVGGASQGRTPDPFFFGAIN